MAHDPHDHGSDKRAAFTGLILGAIALLLIIGTVSKLTTAHYKSEAAAEAHK